MNISPGTIEWAIQAMRNAQQSAQRASDVMLQHGLTNEAKYADQVRLASSQLVEHMEAMGWEPPKQTA